METIPLASDALGPDLLPLEELADCAQTALARDGRTILSYGAGAGYTPLRELIGEWFGVHPGRVVLTNGWVHGLSLLAERRAAARNVVVEYPINDRAEKVFLDAGAALVGITVEEQGLSVDELQQLLVQYAKPAIIFTIPTFHNPTGWTATLERRRRLVQLTVAEHLIQVEQSLVLEDGSYALTRFEGEALPAVFDLSGRSTAFSSSFATTIAPGLRVAWFILPEALASELAAAATDSYITPVLLAQATAFEFLSRGSFEPHLERLREALKLRRDAMIAALEKHLPDATWSRPEGGYFVWLQLPGMPDGRAILERADGVTAMPGTAFGAMSSFLRLSYACAAPDELEAGVERIAAAL